MLWHTVWTCGALWFLMMGCINAIHGRRGLVVWCLIMFVVTSIAAALTL